MATSNDDEGKIAFGEKTFRENSEGRQGETSDKRDEAGGNARGERPLEINPEVLRGSSPLPDLDEIEVVFVQHAPTWGRWTEGLMIHVVGSGLVAVIAFGAGLMFMR